MSIEESSKVKIPSRPQDLKDIAKVIDDICNVKTMIAAKNDYIKEAKKALKDDHELDGSAITLMIKLREKEMAEDYFETQDELHTLYEKLFNLNENGDSE